MSTDPTKSGVRSFLARPGVIVAGVGLASMIVVGLVAGAQLPTPEGGLPTWSYWAFAGSTLLWVWGIAMAIPRRFRWWAAGYAAICTVVVLLGTRSLAGS